MTGTQLYNVSAGDAKLVGHLDLTEHRVDDGANGGESLEAILIAEARDG